MPGLFFSENISCQKKKIGTVLLCLAVAAAGVSYQFYYHLRRVKCREIITGYYRKYTHQEPAEIPLRHLTQLAVNRWGLKRVEKVFFIGEKGPQKT